MNKSITNLRELTDSVLRDPDFRGLPEICLVCLSWDGGAMGVTDAALLHPSTGRTEAVSWIDSEDRPAPGVEIFCGRGDLAEIFLTRSSARDSRVRHIAFPVFSTPALGLCTTGRTIFQAAGQTLLPGDTAEFQEASMKNPAVQAALQAFLRSDKVREGVAEARQAFLEKEGRA